MCGAYIFIVGLLMALTLHTKSFGTCYNVVTLFYHVLKSSVQIHMKWGISKPIIPIILGLFINQGCFKHNMQEETNRPVLFVPFKSRVCLVSALIFSFSCFIRRESAPNLRRIDLH